MPFPLPPGQQRQRRPCFTPGWIQILPWLWREIRPGGSAPTFFPDLGSVLDLPASSNLNCQHTTKDSPTCKGLSSIRLCSLWLTTARLCTVIPIRQTDQHHDQKTKSSRSLTYQLDHRLSLCTSVKSRESARLKSGGCSAGVPRRRCWFAASSWFPCRAHSQTAWHNHRPITHTPPPTKSKRPPVISARQPFIIGAVAKGVAPRKGIRQSRQPQSGMSVPAPNSPFRSNCRPCRLQPPALAVASCFGSSAPDQ